jgi:hypothetical protein
MQIQLPSLAAFDAFSRQRWAENTLSASPKHILVTKHAGYIA